MNFFEVITEKGIRQSRVAREMGLTKEHFTRVKQGDRPLTADFIRRGTEALIRLGIRDEEGCAYPAHVLFPHAQLFTNVNENDPSVTRTGVA